MEQYTLQIYYMKTLTNEMNTFSVTVNQNPRPSIIILLFYDNGHLLNATITLCVTMRYNSVLVFGFIPVSCSHSLCPPPSSFSLSHSSCLQDRQNVRTSQVRGDISWF